MSRETEKRQKTRTTAGNSPSVAGSTKPALGNGARSPPIAGEVRVKLARKDGNRAADQQPPWAEQPAKPGPTLQLGVRVSAP